MEISNLITPEVLQIAGTIVSGLLVYLIKQLSGYLKTKTQNENTRHGMFILEEVLTTTVKQTEQTFKKDMLKENSDKKLSPLDRKKLRDFAIGSALSNLRKTTRKEIERSIPDVHEYASSKLEQILHDIKTQSNKDSVNLNPVGLKTNATKKVEQKPVINIFGMNK